MPSKRSIADRVAGGIFVIMGIVALAEGWRLYPMRTRGIVGDEAFPLVLGFVMVGLGAILALFPGPAKKRVTWPKGKQAAVMAEGAAILVLYWLLLPYVGFPISTYFAAAGLFYTIGRFRWYGCLLSSAVLTSAFHGIFILWLKMPFPTGVFGV
jgi:putative tricarboxylic transport membrane protein